MWYVFTMVYYSAIKRNEIGSCVEMWMSLSTAQVCLVHLPGQHTKAKDVPRNDIKSRDYHRVCHTE